jgi:hypothetical protein
VAGIAGKIRIGASIFIVTAAVSVAHKVRTFCISVLATVCLLVWINTRELPLTAALVAMKRKTTQQVVPGLANNKIATPFPVAPAVIRIVGLGKIHTNPDRTGDIREWDEVPAISSP